MEGSKQYLTVPEAAKRLDRPEPVIRRWCRYKDFGARVGGRWTVPVENVEMIENHIKDVTSTSMVLA